MAATGRRRTLRLLVDRAQSSLWFVPSAMVVAAVALSSGMLYLDEALAVEHPRSHWWFFGGNAEGARTLLSVIAGSLITVISVAFSVTMIAIQQAATQYTPRVLRNFTKDRGNQVVLGIYIATFTYALLVLREVREARDGGEGFVPTWSILGAMVLAMASLAALIYFIHHVSESMQVSYLLGVIRRELDAQIPTMFPETVGEGAGDPEGLAERAAREEVFRGADALVVRSGQEGYLRRIDEGALVDACEGLDLVVVPVQIGERLQRDTVVLRGWPDGDLGADVEERLRGAFELDLHRSIDQDVLFGVRQLVDIAVKALSPGINDPTTAEQAVAELVGALALLARREMPDPSRRLDARTRFLFKVPTFEEIVDESFSQIRHAAHAHAHVTVSLLAGVRVVASRVRSEVRRAALRWQVAQILEALPRAGLASGDEAKVRSAAAATLDALAPEVAGSRGVGATPRPLR